MSADSMARRQLGDAIERLRAVMLKTEGGDWRELEAMVSRYSEDTWSAGWLHDVEFLLWDQLVTAHEVSYAGEFYQMATLALAIGGWVYWDEEQPSKPVRPDDGVSYNRVRFVPFDEWLPLYEKWRAKREQEDRR